MALFSSNIARKSEIFIFVVVWKNLKSSRLHSVLVYRIAGSGA